MLRAVQLISDITPAAEEERDNDVEIMALIQLFKKRPSSNL
jgi:hypothetical protein